MLAELVSQRMSAQPMLLGSRRLTLLGVARSECKVQPVQMGSWKKRLPTIVEADAEELEEVGVQAPTSPTSTESSPTSTPSLALAGLPESLTDPLSIISNTDNAAVVVERLKDGSKTDRRQLFTWLLKALPILSVFEGGSKVVQVALEVATGSDRIVIAHEFHGSVLNLCTSPYGHEVLVTLVQTMPVSSIGFVASEIEGRGKEIACDRYGSSVLEAMTMHCSQVQMAKLAAELANEAVDLSRHSRGSAVVQSLLEYASPECRVAIAQRLIPKAAKLAKHATASRVVEKAFRHCDDEQQQAIASSLLQAHAPQSLVDVACSRRGSSILEEISRSSIDTTEFCSQFAKSLPRLRKAKFGRRVMQHFGLTSLIQTEAEMT